VIGVIRPGARTACSCTRNGRIGVIGTRATVSSGSYTDFIHEIMPEAEVFAQACPLFVPLVEEGLWEDPVTDETEESDMKYDIPSIQKALYSLPDHYRAILSLHLFEGYDYQEISQITGTNESTIRSLYMRGRQKLAAALKQKNS
jgi:RNA polymerase sigma factor (sigma-70 family)